MMEVPFHYQFRIIVIGDTMVGKSSLLKTFSEGTFGEMEPTVGVDFFSKIIEVRPKHLRSMDDSQTINNSQEDTIIVKLQIWDTAGQERFKSIVTSYYRNSVGIVLVYDVTNRESYDHLIDWFTEARRHVEPSPSPTLSPITQNPPKISSHQYPFTSTPTKQRNCHNNHNSEFSSSFASINNNGDATSYTSLSDYQQTTRHRQETYKMAYLVLGCKTDLAGQRQVSYEDGQAFADMYGFKFIETSSRMNYNINQAFQLLAEEIYDKISECGRQNKLHRTPSGTHLTFDGTHSQINEGIRLGPLIENNTRRLHDPERVRLLEAQPVSGFLGGCC